jgi:hypothetical protein
MNKRWAVAGAVAAVVSVGAGTTAGAIPKSGSTWTCEGEEVFIAEAGRNGWVNGEQHYQAVYINFTQVFTPVEGDPQFFSFEKFYGNRGNLVAPDAVRCEQHFEQMDAGGTFVSDGFVIAIPVN